MRRYLLPIFVGTSVLIGCASPTSLPGIKAVGQDSYMIFPPDNPGNLSVNGVKSAMIKQAEDFCQADGRRMQQIISAARENAIGIYAAPEVQFKCMAPRDSDNMVEEKKRSGKLEIR